MLVYDETASMRLVLETKYLKDPSNVEKLKVGSVLTLQNASSLLDINNNMNLTITSANYCKVSIYNLDSDDESERNLAKFGEEID